MLDIFDGKPAALLAAVAAVLNLAVGVGLGLTSAQVGLINAAVAAAVALISAVKVRPFPVPLVIGVFNAGAALAVGFGLHLAPGFVGLADAAIVAVLAYVLHQTVAPTSSYAAVRSSRGEARARPAQTPIGSRSSSINLTIVSRSETCKTILPRCSRRSSMSIDSSAPSSTT